MSRILELAGAVEIVVDFCVDFCLGHNAEIFFGHSPFTQIFALEETLTAFSFQLLVSVTQHGVSYEGIAHILGRSEMHWYRLCQSLGRMSIVGTTVKGMTPLPPI